MLEFLTSPTQHQTLAKIMTAARPAPKVFCKADAEASMIVKRFDVTNRGGYIQSPQFINPLFENGLSNWVLPLAVLAGSFFDARTLGKSDSKP